MSQSDQVARGILIVDDSATVGMVVKNAVSSMVDMPVDLARSLGPGNHYAFTRNRNVARRGGEEFCIIAVNKASVEATLNRLRHCILKGWRSL